MCTNEIARFVSHFFYLSVLFIWSLMWICDMITYFRTDMKGKEGSGIQKYTESPVTSRSISEKDMTSVYISIFFS